MRQLTTACRALQTARIPLPVFATRTEPGNMTLPAIVTEATAQSFALMFVVLSAFFVYFCAIFWAFHTPRLTEQNQPEDQRHRKYLQGTVRFASDPLYSSAALGDRDLERLAGLKQQKRDRCMFSYVTGCGETSKIPRAIPV